MTDRVLKVLEFDKIRSMLADCAVSVMGREFAEKLRPVSDYEAAARLQEETAEAEAELIRTGRSPVDSFPDVRASLRRSGVTLALGPGELLAIARALRAARFARTRNFYSFVVALRRGIDYNKWEFTAGRVVLRPFAPAPRPFWEERLCVFSSPTTT